MLRKMNCLAALVAVFALSWSASEANARHHRGQHRNSRCQPQTCCSGQPAMYQAVAQPVMPQPGCCGN